MIKKLLTLGRIIIFLIPVFAIANSVTATVDSKNIYKGNKALLSIKATGSDIEFPEINTIDNKKVTLEGISNSIITTNGKVDKSIIKKYSFIPDKNCTIESFEIKIDGKIYKTNPINITVSNKPKALQSQSAFIQLSANKTKAYVAEPIELKVELFLPKDIAKYQIAQPNLDGFWVKQIGSPNKSILNGGAKIEYKFILTPQKAGTIKLNPIRVDIAKVQKSKSSPFGDDDFFNFYTQRLIWDQISSNGIEFNILPLPQNLEVAGEFKIDARVDKNHTKAGKPVNLIITIDGIGNLEDIEKFNLELEDGVVYADEPKVTSKIQNGKQIGTFEQKIAIIADKNFTIPSFELKYFNTNTKEPTTIKTDPINIKVKSLNKALTANTKLVSKPKPQVKKEPQIIHKETNSISKYLYMTIGLIVGFGLGYFVKLPSKKREKKELPIITQIKKAKDDKELFKIILPYSKEDATIEQILKKLEENIYKQANNQIDKNSLIEYFEDKKI